MIEITHQNIMIYYFLKLNRNGVRLKNLFKNWLKFTNDTCDNVILNQEFEHAIQISVRWALIPEMGTCHKF